MEDKSGDEASTTSDSNSKSVDPLGKSRDNTKQDQQILALLNNSTYLTFCQVRAALIGAAATNSNWAAWRYFMMNKVRSERVRGGA